MRRPKRRRPPTWFRSPQPDGTVHLVRTDTGRVEGRITYDFPGAEHLRIPVRPAGYMVNP